MAKKEKKPSSGGNKKVIFGGDKKAKRTSIGKSKNSRPKDKASVREKRGR